MRLVNDAWEGVLLLAMESMPASAMPTSPRINVPLFELLSVVVVFCIRIGALIVCDPPTEVMLVEVGEPEVSPNAIVLGPLIV